MPRPRPDIPAFWTIIDELIAAGEAEEGTIMGHPCLRVNGAAFATAGHFADEVIVKLPADRVEALIAERIGDPFPTAKRPFREWAAIPASHQDRWRGLVEEVRAFVAAPAAWRPTAGRLWSANRFVLEFIRGRLIAGPGDRCQ